MVTHANFNWTNLKLDKLGWWKYFDRIIVVNEDKFKGIEHWKLMSEQIGVVPRRCLVTGDNLNGDMAGVKLGMRGILLPAVWSMYNQGEVPEGVVRAKGIAEVPDVIRRMAEEELQLKGRVRV